jgi:hypothetical protein
MTVCDSNLCWRIKLFKHIINVRINIRGFVYSECINVSHGSCLSNKLNFIQNENENSGYKRSRINVFIQKILFLRISFDSLDSYNAMSASQNFMNM